MNGQVLLLPIVSHGEFWAEFSKRRLQGFLNMNRILFHFIIVDDVNAIAKMYGKQIIKNGEPYMTIEKMVVDFVMKSARFRVRDQTHQQLSKNH